MAMAAQVPELQPQAPMTLGLSALPSRRCAGGGGIELRDVAG
jgi:hypothetical protein